MINKNNKKIPRSELMLHTPIAGLIPRMAIPTIIAQLITTIYNLTDTYFVSSIGTYATAAVGVNGSLERTLTLIGSFIGSGACSYIARLLGAQQKKEASTVLSTSFFTGLGLGLIFTFVGLAFKERMVYLFGATADCAVYAMQYAQYVLLAAPFVATSMILNMCLRNEGSATRAMIGTGLGGVLNMILDPIFIFALDLGVAGASMATAISKFVSFCILIYPYVRKKTTVILSVRKIHYSLIDIKEVVGIGATAFFRTGCMVLSGIILNRLAGSFSTSALAAVSIANRIMEFPFAIILGFGQGYQPVIGFNWGAKAFGRVRESIKFGSLVAVVGAIVLGTALFVFAEPIIRVFNSEADEQVLRLGIKCIRMQSLALPIQAWGTIVNMFFAGSGAAKYALLMSTSRQGYLFIPLLFIIPRFYGPDGLTACQAAADVLSLAISIPLAFAARRMISRSESSMEANGPEIVKGGE